MRNEFKELEKAIDNKFLYEELLTRPKKKIRGSVVLNTGEIVVVGEYEDEVKCDRSYYNGVLSYITTAKSKWDEIKENASISGLSYRYSILCDGTLTTQGPVKRTISGKNIIEYIMEEIV